VQPNKRFEPGERYSPAFCREALAIATEEPIRFLNLTHRFSKTVSVEQAERSMVAWGIVVS
jgi:hypothetical protein